MDRVHYRNEITDAPSEQIWGDPELIRACKDPRYGAHWFDDFMAFGPVAASQSNVMAGLYRVFTSASCSITGAAEAGGGITLTTDTTDNTAVGIAFGVWPINILGTTSGKKFACELRLKLGSVAETTAAGEVFAGLMDNTALSATMPLTATAGTVGNCQMIGFHRPEANGAAIDTIYNSENSPTQIKDSALTSSAGTNSAGDATPAIAAATYVKLGIKYDPQIVNINGDNLGFYADGILLDDGLTNAQIAALTTLAADYVSLCVAVRNATTTANTVGLAWWKMAHLL